MRAAAGAYMTRERMADRRRSWRQKVRIGGNVFYVEFGEYPGGRLGEVFITAKKFGTFARGALDSLARSVSLALQSGTHPHDMARQLIGQEYPPQGRVEAEGSTVTECASLADYLGQEILASYDEDGRRREVPHAGVAADEGGADDSGRAVEN